LGEKRALGEMAALFSTARTTDGERAEELMEEKLEHTPRVLHGRGGGGQRPHGRGRGAAFDADSRDLIKGYMNDHYLFC
jgi:hypothetical protein